VQPGPVRVGRLATASAALATAIAASPAQGAGQHLSVVAAPGLSPSFSGGVPDYVSRCSRKRPLRLTIDTPPGRTVSVDGHGSRSGRFKTSVVLRSGQGTQLVVHSPDGGHTYHVRCLPSGFPSWRFQPAGRPQAAWYLMAPSNPNSATTSISKFVTIIDGHGVPVWWKRETISPFNSVLLPDGDLAWTRSYNDPFGMRDSEAWEVHRLDGTLVRTLKTVGSPADTHEMQPLANGDFMLTTYRLRRDVNLKRYGKSAHSNVVDGEIQEISPSGQVVWSWSSRDHTSPAETQEWAKAGRTLPDGTPVWDIFHLNSLAPDGHGGLVISARHVNAVYRIDRATGKITWKLGGTKRPQSLKVVGDRRSPTFGLQHDARVLGDGSVTVYDNRTDLGPPRAVRFRIDAVKHRARFVEQVTDSKARISGSEGSARRLPGGDWVVSWGGTKLVSEVSRSGRIVWRLIFADTINYRVTPIPAERLSARALRRAMDRMHPRG
jgi:hypothetical protein